MSDGEHYEKKYLEHVTPPSADGQIESLSKHQQAHSDVQCYGPPDNNVYCLQRSEEVRERAKMGDELEMTRFQPHLQLESRLDWMLLKFKVKRR